MNSIIITTRYIVILKVLLIIIAHTLYVTVSQMNGMKVGKGWIGVTIELYRQRAVYVHYLCCLELNHQRNERWSINEMNDGRVGTPARSCGTTASYDSINFFNILFWYVFLGLFFFFWEFEAPFCSFIKKNNNANMWCSVVTTSKLKPI